MVTGSHIPADRNGIKFYKPAEEVLKTDEAAVKEAVAAVRQEIYAQPAEAAKFNAKGALKDTVAVPAADNEARDLYLKRYADTFAARPLDGRKIVLYQHSAVVRDMLQELLERLGAEVIPVGRSETFVPIDTENVTEENRAYFKQLAAENPGAFAIVSTDGDSDRPFVIDERGEFHRGDVLGAVVCKWLGADFAAFPISTSDAVDTELNSKKIDWAHTRIGSPFVIAAMKEAVGRGKQRVVGWEVNGGFLTGSDLEINGQTLTALATRDAVLPILVALVAALSTGKKLSEIFLSLPQRFTQAGLIDNFPVEQSRRIVETFGEDTATTRERLSGYFTADHGFGSVQEINPLDGVRIFFDNGDIVHLRPSGNAPQFRVYAVADSQERADEIVRLGIGEPDGILRRLARDIA
jgi:phosphomannomutase